LAPTERLAARLSDPRVTALKQETEKLRKEVVAAYEFREDEAHKVAWDPVAAPRSRLGIALVKVARLIGNRAWQFATISVGAVAVAIAAQWAIDTRRAADVSSQLSAYAQGLGQLSSQVNSTTQILQGLYKSDGSSNLSPRISRKSMRV
jgi:hypothetical protein